jgi:hypothetical protein
MFQFKYAIPDTLSVIPEETLYEVFKDGGFG